MGVAVLDASGRIGEVNEAFASLLGRPRSGLSSLDVHSLVHPDDRAESVRLLNDLFSGRRDRYSSRKRVLHATGQTVWIDEHVACRRDESGDVIAVVVTATDASLMVAAERACSDTRQTRIETARVLAGGIAHEINNVLSVVVACASNLGETTDEEIRQDADAILAASARATRLTHRLNTFVSNRTIDAYPTDIRASLAEAEASLIALVPSHVSFELQIAHELPLAFVEPESLLQVLRDLIANSVEAKAKRVVVRAAMHHVDSIERDAAGADLLPGEYAAVTVEDDGVGMNEAVRDRSFEPFFTTKSCTAGLGLSSAYGIVRRHGGAFILKSDPGRGCAISVLWRAGGGDGVRPPHSSRDQNPRERPTVVVVDDEPAVARSVARLLERRAFDVVVCTRPSDALEALAAGPPGRTMLLSDVVMPQMGGVELANEARSRIPHLPVLLMSGYTGGIDVAKHGYEVISKPFDAATLTERLLAIAELARAAADS